MRFGISCGLVAAGVLFSSMSASASGINYTCSANVPTAVCNYLNGANISGLYAGALSSPNPQTYLAQVYIQFGSTGLGESQQYYNSISYNNYRSALISDSSGDATDTSALASLPSTEPSIFGGNNIYMTTALESALGLGSGSGVDINLNQCTVDLTSTNPSCWDGRITISNSFTYWCRGVQASGCTTGSSQTGLYDFFNVVEHETDEVLGTPSCIVNIAGSPNNGCTGGASPADLFRYSGSGTRAFVSQGTSAFNAYFSVNGGVTSIAAYNNTPGGGDYGDWSTTCAHIQDAFGCQGLSMDITSNGGVEVKVLDAVGYNGPAATPEPATWMLSSLGGAGVVLLRRRRKNAA